MRKKKNLAIINDDPWLEPYSDAINGRHQDAVNKIAELTGGTGNLVEFANAYNYYGLHRIKGGWVFREWAPNATEIYLIGQFNDWRECAPYRLKRLDDGNWEIKLPARAMHHGDLYKLRVHWQGGEGERIPAYATRVVQDEKTYIFSAQVWDPEERYEFKVKDFVPNTAPLLIYECHIGMAQNREGVGTYEEF
ncbi:MAG: 1,4-alpha-glucan-branching enzyme, partial [Muribaculaceae bacterium]|nr:1,4-alpha-glucan-branching enzyme [Muribaculaceae bacterium]